MKRTMRDRDGNRYEWDATNRLWRMVLRGTQQTRLTKYGNLRRSQTPTQTERVQESLGLAIQKAATEVKGQCTCGYYESPHHTPCKEVDA